MARHEAPLVTFGTTLDYLMGVPEFAARFCSVPMPAWAYGTGYSLRDELALFWQVLCAGLKHQGLLLYTGRGRIKPEVLAVAVLGCLPRRVRATVVLCGESWEPNQGWRARLDQLMVRLADRAVSRYALLSNDERRLFTQLWGVAPTKVRFIPCMYSFGEEAIDAPVGQGDYVFAGGNSFRDYGPLVEAARAMPERQFVIATRKLADRTDLPPNVQAGPVSTEAFVRLMRGAAAVVVPLRLGTRRASGQQTFLNSMWLRRLTIVNAALGVTDYVRDHENGLVVSGTPASYVTALRWALDPANAAAVARITARAHTDTTQRFNRNCHARDLVMLMEEAIAERA